ncbi:hypothetical protein KZP23_14540 [Echinicola marina]|uniref:YfaP family protein n=1 Tax=Echinicola marina TaxID=2859768 RepID=UPI001CF65DD2|nr:hypothetical protein [Echinicola marina]UCS91941.1 hypothetical protein KZP23_14540 [Echinicola marina]
MKNLLIHLTICLLFFSCSLIEEMTNDEEEFEADVSIVHYTPEAFGHEEIAPQVSLKNDQFQVTSFGRNDSEYPSSPEKLYLSDMETGTEWVVLLNSSKEAEFMYGINTATHERLPYLYHSESIDESAYYLRFYHYDWENRLGTLLYEAKIDNEIVEVIFDNELSPSDRINPDLSKTKTKAFPAPVIGLYNRKSKSNSSMVQRVTATSVDDLDDFFDSQVKDLMEVLKDTKTKLINAPCNVSKVLNKSDKNFVCKLSDNLNKITDEEIFGDIYELTDEEQYLGESEFQGENDISISLFDDVSFIDDIRDHINDIRNKISESEWIDLDDWLEDLDEIAIVEEEDLDDLSDSNGVIQIGLSWDTEADIDLHVTDPNGETIYYDNPSSASGGYLDRDDVDGFGPENIYWTSDIPNGNFSISLVYYAPSENAPLTDCVVKVINGLGAEKTFRLSLGYFDHNKVHVANFQRQGHTLTFE